jgi:hypothetical protein
MKTKPVTRLALRAGVLIALGVMATACPVTPTSPPATTTTTAPGSTTTSTTSTTTSTTSTTAAPTTTTTIPAGPACTPSAAGPVLTVAPSSGPDSTLTVAPALNGADFTYGNVDLCWNLASSVGHRTFFLQCKKDPADPTFNYAIDCSNLSEITPNPLTDAFGTTPFQVFRGLEPSGDESWGCYAPGDVAPAGVTKYTDCWIRFTQGTENNTTDQVGVKIHFA